MAEQATSIFGIDLGTTYSCIAHIDEYGRPDAIINAEGDRTTPSVVLFEGANIVVGKEAKNSAVSHKDQIVELVKRQMGQGDWVFFYNGTEYSAEEISSFILRKVVSDAETALGCTITDVVITCPAYFGINEREATARAGEIAGLQVRSIINEPTAAAIHYGLHAEQDQVVLVYDLGGGTFDITMIEIKEEEINVIATGGDYYLGGRNWDETIVAYLADQWMATTGSSEDPQDDPETLQDLFSKAEQAKRSLSARAKTEVAVTHVGQRQQITLTRAIVRQKFIGLSQGCPGASPVHTSMWSKGS
jgi:molecular chaperone DnaK (HSP70)